MKYLINYGRLNSRAIIGFLFTGGVTFFLCVGIFSLCTYVLHFHYILSVTIAYTISAFFHFFSNRHIAFKGGAGKLTPQAVKYIILVFLNYLITCGVLKLTVFFLHSSLTGIIASSAVTAMTGYLLFKYWVFKKPSLV